jgi:RecG-like helicase
VPCGGANAKRRIKRSTVGDGRMVESILFDFPHALTASQETAIAEIIADLARPHVTTRLVQGDVGSGKTMVALLGAAAVIFSALGRAETRAFGWPIWRCTAICSRQRPWPRGS